MKDMKLTDAELKERDSTSLSEEDKYPYGLRVHVDNNSMDKLGMDLPEIGTTMILVAEVEVVSVSQYASPDNEDKSFSLQIQQMELKDKPSAEAKLKRMYPSSAEE